MIPPKLKEHYSEQPAQQAVYNLTRDRYIQRLQSTIKELKKNRTARILAWAGAITAMGTAITTVANQVIDILIKLHIL